TTYFVVDGAKAMFEDDVEGGAFGPGCSFVKAIKAIYTQCARMCATEEALRHYVGVLIINTTFTETDPEMTMGAENMKHLFPIGCLNKERVLMLEEFLQTDDLQSLFIETFGGHTRANWQKVASYSKLNISYSSTSRRFTSWVLFTNDVAPFGKRWQTDDEYARMLRNLRDIEGRSATQKDDDAPRRPLRGRCTVFVLGDEKLIDDAALAMWRTVDEEAGVYDNDLEESLIRRTGAVRTHAVIPFSLGNGLEFNVAVYSLVATKTKPTPFSIHAKTGASLKSITTYSSTTQETPHDADDEQQGMETEETKEDIPKQSFQRHQLAQMRNVGGERILITQGDRDVHHRYKKGLRLLEFRPLSEIDLWEHVSPSLTIRPHDNSHLGATSLYSHLLDRMEHRQVVAICEYVGRANQKPRIVALIPNTQEDQEAAVHLGFLLVELHDPDDKMDIAAAFEEKMKPPEGMAKWPTGSAKAVDAAKTLCTALLKKRFTPTAYPNPHLQAFYTMLKREANLDTPDNETEEWTEAMRTKWDHIKPWFDNDAMPASRAGKAAEAADEIGRLTGTYELDPKATTAKRATAKKDEAAAPKKRGRGVKMENDVDDEDEFKEKQEQLPSRSVLMKMTVANLKEKAAQMNVDIKKAKKKDEIIDAILDHPTSK
ncbi:unnamed protein product, partial [Mesorhabditis spiculigera]